MKFQIFSILKINFYEWLISGHFFKKVTIWKWMYL
jgi:hypothetical protein